MGLSEGGGGWGVGGGGGVGSLFGPSFSNFQ